MIYLFYGNEPYTKDLKMSQICQDSEVLKVEEITSDCIEFIYQNSIVGKKVLIYNTEKLGADEKLLNFIKEVESSENDIIVVANKVNQNTKVYQLMQQYTIINCEKLNEYTFLKFLEKGLSKYNASMSDVAKEVFTTECGYFVINEINLYKITILIKQLVFHSRCIIESDVTEFLQNTEDYNGLKLSSLIFNNDKYAMDYAYRISQTNEYIKIISLLLRGYRISLKVSLYQHNRYNEIYKELGLNSYQMKYLREVMKLHPNTLNNSIDVLQFAAHEIKSGYPPKDIFILAMAKLINLYKGER